MIRQEEPKPKWTEKRSREFDLHTQYNTLRMLGDRDIVSAVASTCGFTEGSVAHAKRFWHDVFRDLPELRTHFPHHAERFGPYPTAAIGSKTVLR
jgi:hypothetical protein